jgi:tRNA-dihydrouridine synthase 1
MAVVKQEMNYKKTSFSLHRSSTPQCADIFDMILSKKVGPMTAASQDSNQALTKNDGNNDNEKDNDVNMESVPEVDRQWLLKLLKKHSSDPRLVPYYAELHEKYPILKDKALVVAPMVDQSDLPFRLLCRNYGTNLCFTPMVHAKMFHQKEAYKKQFWSYVNGTPPGDRPLIVQLCGSDTSSLIYTIRYILSSKGSVDGFDLNCGCPQTIAKRGNYGAYLLEKEDGNVVVDVVKKLVEEVGQEVPISVKVRILPSGVEDSLKLYKRLVDAGASMLTIHGRNRMQKGLKTGKTDWDAIKQVVELFGDKIPIMANGGISNLDDVRECLEYTGVDGVMSSEAILEYPALFTDTNTEAVGGKRTGPRRMQLAKEYLETADKHPPQLGGQGNGIKCVRAHIHKILHEDLTGRNDLRQNIALAQDHDELRTYFNDIEELNKVEEHSVESEGLAWYMRHRIPRRNDSNPIPRKFQRATSSTKIGISLEAPSNAAEEDGNCGEGCH